MIFLIKYHLRPNDCLTYQQERVCLPESLGLRGRLVRKIEALKAEESGSGAPDEFLCPITRELMKDPVIAAGGTMLKTDRNFIILHKKFTFLTA